MSLKLHGTGKITGIDQGLSVVGVTTLHNALSVSGDISTGGDVVVGGGLTVTGVLTYEDVTNVDSIGVITARSGIVGDLTGNVTGNVTGDITGNIIGSPTLSGISSSIADTAVDIFVYDTSKDSDGGAWRKRTTHTSWYNETLNTATRGSRREFPAVAVIVADNSSYHIKIYDGDDPDMPLWMEFQDVSSGSGLIPSPSAKPESIAAINGIIVFGNVAGTVNSGQAGVVKLDFIGDAAYRYMQSGSSSYSGKWIGGGLANRNTGTPTTGSWDNSLGYIVDNDVNDVAMTVLPSAPIDSATGLPIPTIVVATDGGVSVIKDDGSVYDINHTSSGYDVVSQIKIDEKYVYIGFGRASDYVGGIGYAVPIPGADVSLGSIVNATSESVFRWSLNSTSGSGGQSDYFINPSDSNADDVTGTVLTKRGMSFGTETGMSILLNEERGTNGSVAYATTSYNTGWMHGDIKGAFLSDTDATNVSGNELVPNSEFLSNAGWTLGTGYSISGGLLSDTSSSSTPTTGASFALATGTHTFSYQATGSGGQPTLYVKKSSDGTAVATLQISSNPFDGVMTSTFNVTSAENYYVEVNGAGFIGTYDYISVIAGTGTRTYTSESDRSVNNKPLDVHGTVTKSAVATGAELVAYSGFSNSNYLVQPYNSDMQTGTGAFSATAWFKTTSTEENYEGLLYYNRSGSIGDGWQIMLEPNSDGKGLYFYTYGASANIATSSVDGLNDGVWHQVVVTHNNGSIQMFIDGTLRQSSSNPSAGSINDSQAKLHIGRWYGNANSSNYWWRGSIALARHSASVPSAAQIKKIYEDEKILFQENAACTLYGSSDAVTALAYDEVTDRLHVGTSSGRSDFQGLRRINNTTTAVTTAISAHDEFIAEQ